jgi:hypothetical protein
MKNILLLLFCFQCYFCIGQIRDKEIMVKTPLSTRSLPTLAAPTVSVEVMQSYKWWKNANPNNTNYFATFTNVNPANNDTGVISYSKRTALSLVGWINQNVNFGILFSNDSMVHLEPLIYLQQLLLRYDVNDAGISHLRNLKNLKHLELAVTSGVGYNITDKSMDVISQLTNLEILRLYGCTNVTDQGLNKLASLSNLTELVLTGWGGISDRGLSVLPSFTKLKILRLSRTAITDAGLLSLGLLNNLVNIDLEFDAITNKGLENLFRVKNLTNLNLSNTQITDDGAEMMIKLILQKPSLKILNIYGGKMSSATKQKMSASCPGVTFYY